MAREPASTFFKQVIEAQQSGEIIPIDPRQLMVNIMDWCQFPQIASPIIKHVGGMDQRAFQQFLNERSRTVAALIIRSIRA